MLSKHGFDHSINEWETHNAAAYSCPLCGASDRDRLIGLYLRKQLGAIRGPISLLEFAPSASLSPLIASYPDVTHHTADLYMPNVEFHVDITKLEPFANASVDAFLCSHVLEHVEKDQKAMAELHRILRPGGWGIVLVPISLKLPNVREGIVANTDEERWRLYGQNDHIRCYTSSALVSRLSLAGFSVKRLGANDFPEASFSASGLTQTSVLYEVTKPRDSERKAD
jgi:SAM-dependent methyltransferase